MPRTRKNTAEEAAAAAAEALAAVNSITNDDIEEDEEETEEAPNNTIQDSEHEDEPAKSVQPAKPGQLAFDRSLSVTTAQSQQYQPSVKVAKIAVVANTININLTPPVLESTRIENNDPLDAELTLNTVTLVHPEQVKYGQYSPNTRKKMIRREEVVNLPKEEMLIKLSQWSKQVEAGIC